jgi:hypothetical protein
MEVGRKKSSSGDASSREDASVLLEYEAVGNNVYEKLSFKVKLRVSSNNLNKRTA